MAILISDDGLTQTWQGEDGQAYQVASQFAPPLPGMGTPAMPPAPAFDPTGASGLPPMPEAELNFAPDVLSQPQPDPALAGPGAAFQAPPLPAPVAPEVAPAPAPEPVVDMPLDPADDFATPSVLPEGSLNKPTQIADAINLAGQEKADSARRVAQAGEEGTEQIINAGLDAQANVVEVQKQRAVEAQMRQADEAVLTERHGKMIDRYANFKVDPNRGVSSDRQTMAWIGAALAGLGQVIAGKDPSQNPVIPLIFAQMDRRVQEQMAERDSLGSAIGMSRDKIADFRAGTKTRLGEYDLRMAAHLERAAKETERVGAKLGSIEQREGATQLAATIRAEATARSGSATKAEADQRAAERRAAGAAMAARAKAERDEARFQAKEGIRFNPQTGRYEIDPGMQDPTKAIDTQGKLLDNEKKARELARPEETVGSVAAIKDKAARSLNGFDGKPLTRTVVEDGKKTQVRVMAKDDTAATYLTTAGSAVDKLTRAADMIKQLRAKHGGSIKTLGSAEAQELAAVVKDVDLNNLVARNMGVPTGKDMEIVEGLRGGVDPAAFLRDPSVGIEAMATRAIENYNADLRQKSDYFDNADGAVPLKPPRSAAAQVAEQRPDERVATFTKGDPSVAGDAGAVAKDREMRTAAVEAFLKRDKPSPESIDAARRRVLADTYMPPATKAAILATLNDALEQANAPDKKAAREWLKRGPAAGAVEQRLIPEELLFGLPGGAK